VVGDFYIHTSHYPPSWDHPFQLCVQATTAFGSGHHATTQGCLQLIQDVWAKTGWKKALDFGSGSGILAMAMNRISPGSAVGIDNDGEAVRVAQENAESNHCPTLFMVGDCLPDGGPFDCIVANVYGPILVDAAPMFLDAKNVILSGILQIQSGGVIKAYESLGWALEKTIESEEWASLWLRK
jgi:ribosomal protein L11 methyltransferase